MLLWTDNYIVIMDMIIKYIFLNLWFNSHIYLLINGQNFPNSLKWLNNMSVLFMCTTVRSIINHWSVKQFTHDSPFFSFFQLNLPPNSPICNYYLAELDMNMLTIPLLITHNVSLQWWCCQRKQMHHLKRHRSRTL